MRKQKSKAKLMNNAVLEKVEFFPNGFTLYWSADCGFGIFEFTEKNGEYWCDDEAIGPEGVKIVFDLFFKMFKMETSMRTGIALNGKVLSTEDLKKY